MFMKPNFAFIAFVALFRQTQTADVGFYSPLVILQRLVNHVSVTAALENTYFRSLGAERQAIPYKLGHFSPAQRIIGLAMAQAFSILGILAL